MVQRVIALQYNPGSLSQSLVPQMVKRLGVLSEVLHLDSFARRNDGLGECVAKDWRGDFVRDGSTN